MADDDLTAELERIRERYRASFTALPGFSTSPGTPWNHVNSADDVPSLLAAVEAVLKEHRRDHHKTPFCEECGHVWPCSTYRAITAALTGKEHGHD